MQHAAPTLCHMSRRRLICNPADDREFVSTATALARRERNVRAFEANLRTHYPNAAVRDGTLSAEQAERWYVYRDGRWAGDASHLADVEVGG
jgi:hypothetical protein